VPKPLLQEIPLWFLSPVLPSPVLLSKAKTVCASQTGGLDCCQQAKARFEAKICSMSASAEITGQKSESTLKSCL
jgi:hypothetical protein